MPDGRIATPWGGVRSRCGPATAGRSPAPAGTLTCVDRCKRSPHVFIPDVTRRHWSEHPEVRAVSELAGRADRPRHDHAARFREGALVAGLIVTGGTQAGKLTGSEDDHRGVDEYAPIRHPDSVGARL